MANQNRGQQAQRPAVADDEDAVSGAISDKLRRYFLLTQEYRADALASRGRVVRQRSLDVKPLRYARVCFNGRRDRPPFVDAIRDLAQTVPDYKGNRVGLPDQ